VAFDPLHFVLMFPRGEAGWGLGIEKGKPRRVRNAAPVEDDIGDVDEHPGGGVETGDTGEGLDTAERTASEMVNARGRTVTLRDFMAFYLFTRRGTSPWLLLGFSFLHLKCGI
jgi:hypothetical protein